MTFVYFRASKVNHLLNKYFTATFVLNKLLIIKLKKNASIKKNENARLFRFSRSS